MTPKLFTTAAVVLATVGLSAAAVAQDRLPPGVEARQGLMQLQGLHIGVLGGMARGNIDYDAELATLAANNLVAVVTLDQTFMWPEGSDSETIDGTRALPAIWNDPEGYETARQDLIAASQALAAVAGDGLDAVRGAIGPVGGTCGACHDSYRAEN